MTQDATPIPAATVIVLRDRSDGAPEVLMVERAKAMAFAGGALVFPGGRVDPADRALAASRAAGDADEVAHRIAAIRETIEETGIAVGLAPLAGPDALSAMRTMLHAGEPLSSVIEAAGTTLMLDALVPFARWLPLGLPHRIFDTRFYLAQLPSGAPDPVADLGETADAFWATPAEILERAREGRATIIFPTHRNLERLAQYRSHADAVADARAKPIRTITPWQEMRDGVPHICIPDDLGYPVDAVPARDVRRA